MKLGTLMRVRIFAVLAFASAILFTSGVAVGQRANTSKFAKYLGPPTRTEMDLITLEATVGQILVNLPLDQGIGTTQMYFDHKENRVEAVVSIDRDFEKLPLDRVKALIGLKCYSAYEHLRVFIPEISEDDVVLQVHRLDWDPHLKNRLYAECKHGVITFH